MNPTIATVDQLPPTVRTIDREQAAAAIGVSVRTLDTLDATGKGPKALRIGRRRLYRVSDLEAWLEQQVNGPAV
jgi:predicted DNA-binding transcriptional regulator AlpA